MSAHTPGPWAYRLTETYAVLGPDGGRVAICTNLKGQHGLGGRRESNEVAANARLIAAAPELLEALQAMVECSHTNDIQTCAMASQLARAAIVKATGGAA